MAEKRPASDDEDDTLELTEDMKLKPPPEDDGESGDDDEGEFPEEDDKEPGEKDKAEDEGEEETVIHFADEDEPEGPDDTPVIRRLRDRVKELGRENQELRKGETQKEQQELGAKPMLRDFDYDEDKHDAALEAWHDKKRQFEQGAAARDAETKAAEREWQRDMETYAAKRDALAMPDFEDAAEIVKSSLNIAQQATIIKAANNPAAFVYGLAHSDSRLAEIAKVHDPIKLAAVIARMEGGLKVVKRRKAAAPDRPIKGSGKLGMTTDKQLEKLRAEADRTGKRTELIAYQRKLKAKGK
jgi:hypothetical protein